LLRNPRLLINPRFPFPFPFPSPHPRLIVTMAPTPVPENLDIGKSLNHAWKTLKPIMEWTSTVVDKGYMISDFLISKRQKGADAKYAFAKAEAEAYKILEAQHRDRHSKLERRSDKKEEEKKEGHADYSDAKEFVEWMKEAKPEEVIKWAQDMTRTLAEEAKKVQAEREEETKKKNKSS
jgi:hypothetical protein